MDFSAVQDALPDATEGGIWELGGFRPRTFWWKAGVLLLHYSGPN